MSCRSALQPACHAKLWLGCVQDVKEDFYPEFDYTTRRKEWKLLPTVNGRKVVVDPDAEPHDACGKTCNLLQLEDMCQPVIKTAVSILPGVSSSCRPCTCFSCVLAHIEFMCTSVTALDVTEEQQQCICSIAFEPTNKLLLWSRKCVCSQMLSQIFWRDDYVEAWKQVISHNILKGTCIKKGQPTGLQLLVQEWHLRAAFEKDSFVHVLIDTYKQQANLRLMQRRIVPRLK